MSGFWCIVPAAGQGTRFGGTTPKQHLVVRGRSLLEHTLEALTGHPDIAGVVVALAPGVDRTWPALHGKPVVTVVGGATRAISVRAGLDAIAGVDTHAPVLVHDAARPNIAHADLDRLIAVGCAGADGALLAAPVRDTLKRADADGRSLGTQDRAGLWRALTPQMFPRDVLARALDAAAAAGIDVTDEAMAMERLGHRPVLVEGREDNLKITTPADLAWFAWALQQRERQG